MSDVIFTSEFRLEKALAQFNRFADAVQARLKTMGVLLQKAGGAEALTASVAKETKRQQKITDEHLAYKIRETKKAAALETKIREAELKKQTADEVAERKRQQKITDQQLAYNIAQVKKQTTQTERELRDANRRFEKLFAGFTVGGFALQRFGQFLTQGISQPLINFGRQLYDITILVNDFEETLRVRGGKSVEEIEEIYKVVKRVSDLPNLERPDVLTIFSRIQEITQGGITAVELEKIGGGLSKIVTSLEAGEKRAFYGQLQDILGGGNVANLEKTLSLVPLLKSKYDELKLAATVDNTDSSPKTLILKALSDLSILPNIDNIATSVKRLSNEVFEFQRRLGNIYKDELKILVDFVINRVVPLIDFLVTKFEKASSLVHIFSLAILGMAIAIPPLISILGAFGIAIGGIGFALAEFKLAFGSFAGIGARLSILSNFEKILASVSKFILNLPYAISRILVIAGSVTVVVTLLVTAIQKAFSTDAGGFYTALVFLANTILPTIWTVLSSIFNTVSALADVIVNFYNLIDVGGIITSLVGAVGSGLAYVLGTAIQLLNLLAIVPGILQFVADLLGGNVDLAVARLLLTFLKVLKSITIFGKLIEAIFGVDLTKAIADMEAQVESLDKASKGMHANAQTDAEKTKTQQDALTQSYKENQNTIAAITESIKIQTKAIEDNTLKAQANAVARMAAIRDEMAERRSSDLAELDYDLSSETGVSGARESVRQQGLIEDIRARGQKRERVQKELREVLKERREEFLELAKKEINIDTKAVYEQYAHLLKLSIQDQETVITSANLDALIFDALSKQIAKSTLHGPGLKLLFTQLANEKIAIQQAIKTQERNDTEILTAQSKAGERSRQLEKRIREQQIKDNVTRLSSPIELEIARLDRQIDATQDAKSKYFELGNNVRDFIQFIQTLDNYETQLLKFEDERAKKLIALDRIQIKSAAEHKAAEDKINEETFQRKAKIQDDTRRGKKSLIDEIVKDELEQRIELEETLRQLVDKLSTTYDLSLQMEALGIKTDDKIITQFNNSIDAIYKLTTSTALEKLQRTSQILGGRFGVGALPFSEIRNVFDQFKSITQEDLIDPAKRKELILQSDAITKVLQNFITTSADLDPASKTQMQLILNAYLELIKTVKDNEGLLGTKVDINLRDLQVSELKVQRESQLNDLARTNLEIQKEILDIRAEKGYDQDLPTLSALFAVISGSKRATEEAQMRILENQKKGAEIESRLAFLRLEIEQKIFLIKLKELGVSDEEIQNTKELFQLEMDALREKAGLEQILLNEKIDSLKNVLSGQGGLLGSIFASIFGGGKKKETRRTGTTDDEGNIIVNGNEVSDHESAHASVVNDEDLDAIDEFGDKLTTIRDLIFGVGDAIEKLNDKSIKGVFRMLAAEMKALAIKAAIKALEYAAYGVSFLVFGDVPQAKQAFIAAGQWAIVAAVAGAASKFLGAVGGTSSANAESAASRSAGVSTDTGPYDPAKDRTILKQKNAMITILFDIRADDGIIMRKSIKSINGNTQLTTLVSNSQEGWSFPVTP